MESDGLVERAERILLKLGVEPSKRSIRIITGEIAEAEGVTWKEALSESAHVAYEWALDMDFKKRRDLAGKTAWKIGEEIEDLLKIRRIGGHIHCLRDIAEAAQALMAKIDTGKIGFIDDLHDELQALKEAIKEHDKQSR